MTRIGADLRGCFIFRLHFWIPCDTNGCTDFTDFTDEYGFFWNSCSESKQKNKKIRTHR
jgi:hypothetical protein